MGRNKEIWFVTGSQQLYGEDILETVAKHSKEIVQYLDEHCDCNIVWKETVKTLDEITNVMRDAEACNDCIGIITWMHTFSPSKMWINGLSALNKPITTPSYTVQRKAVV